MSFSFKNLLFLLKFGMLGFCVFGLGGCATIFGRKCQQVSFDSVPTGADVYVNGIRIGKTPISTNLILEVKKYDIDSYRRKSEKRRSKVFGNDAVSGQEDLGVESSVSVINNAYDVAMVKEGYRVKRFTIAPRSGAYFRGVNGSLCLADLVFSFVTFGIPLIIDSNKSACVAFETMHSFDLEDGDSVSIGGSKNSVGIDSGIDSSHVFGYPGAQGVYPNNSILK
jgi:hypothetical protein